MTAPIPLLQLRGVQKSYGATKALLGLSLSMRPGEVLGLLGPNGAGKTTCLRILMGQLSPSAGEAEVMGLSCTHDRKGVMGHIGYVPDEPSFFEDLKGEEILQWSGGLRGLSPEEIRTRSAPLIERLELSAVMSKAAGAYSHGMTKKLALTLALLHEPSLLILDEPTAGLDPKGIQTLVDLLKERRSAGAGILYSTHLLEQAEGLCDRVAILKGGALMGLGTLDELHLEAQGRRRAPSPAQDATPRDLKSIFFALTQGGGPPP